MTVTIAADKITNSDSVIRLDTFTANDGVHKILKNPKFHSWTEKVVEWGEYKKIQQCPSCNEFHSAHSPPLCFGCAVGLK